MAPAVLTRQTNQALGLGRYAISFIEAGEPSQAVIERTSMFVTDATFCGLSAIALKTNAPTVLRQQALDSRPNRFTLGNVTQEGVTIFGSTELVCPLEATLADCNAVREWDSNGTNFGYDPVRGNTAGEFGHNDFYPAIFNAAQMCGCDGATLMRALICVDTIRGRLAEVFSLKTYKIDHVLHGGIATAAVVGALLGATAEQIESAIGYTVAHHVPFRAIRAGKDLSDSKGASAAITATAAFKGVLLSMRGFNGPRDIFRNPEAIFRLFEGPGQMLAPIDTDGTLKLPPNVERLDESPFDLEMPMAGDDFPIMGMHIKLALYEHQSAGAVHAVISLLEQNPSLLEGGLDRIKEILILAYEPAFGIIGDPAKMTPGTRQSADHSMPYIVGTLIRKALKQKGASWLSLMLEPMDYHRDVLEHPATRALMEKVRFKHGGKEYDDKYPEGIPTSVVIVDADGKEHSSGLVMFPPGHARYEGDDFNQLHERKLEILRGHAFASDDAGRAIQARFMGIPQLSAAEVRSLNDFELQIADSSFDN